MTIAAIGGVILYIKTPAKTKLGLDSFMVIVGLIDIEKA